MSFKQKSGAMVPKIGIWRLATEIIKVDIPWSAGQRSLLKSLDRMVAMDREESEVYTAMSRLKPWAVGSSVPHFHEWVLPRGAGKTSLAALCAVYDVLTNTYAQAPGETCLVAIMSPTVRQARDAMRYVNAYCEAPAIAPFVESQNLEEINFKNGRIIRAIPVDKKGGRIRGPTFLTLIMDEAAFLEHSGVMVDREIFNAVVAGFRNVPDYRALVISTPNGRTGLVFDVYDQHFGKPGSAWEVFHTDIKTIRPTMDESLLAAIRESDPESYAIEFACLFSSGGSKRYFNEEAVCECIQVGVSKIPPDGASTEYFAGIDVSGGKRDRHAVTVLRRLADRRIQQVASLVFDPQKEAYTMREAARQTAELCAEYGVRTVFADLYGGNYAVEAHREFGLELEIRGMNNTLKVQRARALDELILAKQILLLDIELQTTEILQYERRELPSGQISVGHPQSKLASDDLLDALLLAMYEALGNVEELHRPAENMLSMDWRDQERMYEGGHFPALIKFKSYYLTPRQIAAMGKVPAWLMNNAFRDPEIPLCSLGEIANMMRIKTVQALAFFGRDTVLQHQWLRWTLARHKGSRINGRPALLSFNPNLPAIPAAREIWRRIASEGDDFVQFGFSRVAQTWPIDLLEPAQTRGIVMATRPFDRARTEWCLFPPGYDEEKMDRWATRENEQVKNLIDEILYRAKKEKREIDRVPQPARTYERTLTQDEIDAWALSWR